MFDKLLATSSSALPRLVQVRFNSVNFFQRRTSEVLWKTVTQVSQGGLKRGRSVTRQQVRPLPQFYKIGMLKSSPLRVRYPGLNAPIDPEKVGQQQPLYFEEQSEEEREQTLHFVRRGVERRGKLKKGRMSKEKLSPLERGFSGGSFMGERMGPPPNLDGNDMGDFECICFFHDRTSAMHPLKGRVQTARALVFIGNGKGVGGYGMSTAGPTKVNVAIGRAIKQAARRLFHIERLEDRTIYQDFFAESHNTRVFAKRQMEGFGLRCPARVAKMCELLGIKDIQVRLEGTTNNYIALTHAFVTGLLHQETHQQLADRTRLHVVELQPNRQYFPRIVASPLNAPVKTDRELEPKERMRLDNYYGEGRYPLRRHKPTPPYITHAGHQHAEWAKHPYRNMEEKIIRLLADGVVNRWTRRERYRWAQREHKLVMSGQKPMPLGIGLPHVFPMKQEEGSA